MKNNIKNTVFTVSIFYSIIIIILMIITLCNLVTKVELHDSKENKSKLVEYKEKLNTLDENKCTLVIKDIINHYEQTSYDGFVNIKDMYVYDNENSILSYYIKAKEACNITKEIETEYNLPSKFITSSIQRDETYQRYLFQYELKFTDFYTRLIAEAYIIPIEYEINRTNELEIIENLIEISNREVSIYE